MLINIIIKLITLMLIKRRKRRVVLPKREQLSLALMSLEVMSKEPITRVENGEAAVETEEPTEVIVEDSNSKSITLMRKVS
jgi:hypothetical protein